MNTVRRVILGATLTATTLSAGVAMEQSSVEAANIEQGIFEIPSYCSDYVGTTVSTETERALRSVGFTGIKADGIVTSETEQGAILGAQMFMKDIGVIDSNVEVCGLAGSATLAGVRKMQNPSTLAGESQINQSINTVTPTSTRTPEVNTSYSIEDCKNYDLWSVETIKAVQAALGVRVDGVFGDVSCNSMINFQERNGIAQNGKGYLGNITLTALDVKGERITNNTVSNNIDIDKVVVDKSDNTLTAYDGGQVVDEVRISHGDDRTYTYTVDGRQYTGRATTRTGTTKIYRTEGADYASKTLGGARGSMGYARFFNGGLAVHVGNIYSASHGCVRVALDNMKNLVKNGFGYGDTVVVQE